MAEPVTLTRPKSIVRAGAPAAGAPAAAAPAAGAPVVPAIDGKNMEEIMGALRKVFGDRAAGVLEQILNGGGDTFGPVGSYLQTLGQRSRELNAMKTAFNSMTYSNFETDERAAQKWFG